MIGQVGGQLIGSLIDRRPQKTKKANQATQRNIQTMALQQGLSGAQGQYTSFMKDGGTTSPYEWMSHTWQPQLLAKFGDYDMKDLLKPPTDAEMLRAGGHLKAYTPPSERAMSTERPMMQEGGELQIHWGGDAEPISYNPNLPYGGETILFNGQSHDESDGKGNTGIGITFGDNPVEVERGEPAIKLKDGTGGDSSLVVFGNLKIPHELLGDPKAKGKKFKNYVTELSKKEEKANGIVSKSINQLDELDVQTPFDKLKFNSLDANIMGGNMKLKDYAQKKLDASALQTAMNDTIEEYGLKTTDKGNIMAKLGKKIAQAQDGILNPAIRSTPFDAFVDRWEKFLPEKPTTVPIPYRPEADFKPLEEVVIKGKKKTTTPQTTTAPAAAPAKVADKKKGIDLVGVLNEILPYVRPSDAEELDPNQLMGEMYALSQNQLEPVRAQLFEPELSTPYDISLQDVLNENEAAFRAQQRLFGYNPAAQSQLAAQKYAANQKVLAEQFRMNQAVRDQIFRENRNLLNQAKLQNLATLDQQYVRQQEAKSKTKATAQEALNSISAKYAQNKLENRTLQVYENMYNYRFDPRFRAMNMNPLVDFEKMIANASPTQIAELTKMIEEKAKKSKTEETKKAKNGSIVKALKNI